MGRQSRVLQVSDLVSPPEGKRMGLSRPLMIAPHRTRGPMTLCHRGLRDMSATRT